MGFSGQEYWSGLPCPPPGDPPNPGITPKCPALQADSLPSEPPGKPKRILEWDAMPSSRGSSQRRDQAQVSCIAGRRFTLYAKGQIHIPILKCCMAKPAVPLMSSKSAPCTLYTKIIQSQWQAWMYVMGFPGGSDCKESACNERDLDLIHGLGGSPGGGHGNPLQYSCLENPQGQRSLVGYCPWGCKESDMIGAT